MRFLNSRVLRSRWFRTAVGIILLCILIWIFGPLFGVGQAHPLDSEIARLIVIAALVLFWLIMNLVRSLRDARKEKHLVEDVAKPEPDETAAASAAEVEELGKRLKDALHTLKKAKLGGGKRLYQLPWYMFIGPPGAGKTTALANCGLRFPLADSNTPAPLAGVGGTRNCDWWFTDEAVLIDTAGRYTTQDSHKEVDAAAWKGFLHLLKKHRGRQPLNGVLLTISLADLSELNDAERAAHARAMRKRVVELHDELGVRIPIYVLFTKADLIAGFVEFFDGMTREDREQVWGTTFPLDTGKSAGGAVAGFDEAFDALMARLNDRMLERVQQETDLLRRRLIYGFPQQVASLRGTASDFLNEIFKPSRLEARPLLRGVYFASGTQDGTPIDRLLGTMAGQFGLPRQAVAAFSGSGRSYFLQRLMQSVVFGEAGLVSTDPKLEARARWLFRGAYGGAALLLLLLTGIWTVSYVGNRDMIADVHATAALYNDQVRALATRGPQDIDLAATLAPLNTLRTMRGGYEDREKSTPWAMTFGLYQGEKLKSAAVDAYYRALNAFLLPRLLARLEGQLAAHMDKPDFLYEGLKVYLILGGQGPLNAELVQYWIRNDLAATYQGDENDETRGEIAAHVEALLQRPLTRLPLNGDLVASVRGILTQESPAIYSYKRMMRSHKVTSLPEWTVADNSGPEGSRVLGLRSGLSVHRGVPGIYTHAGYHQTFLPLLPTVTQDIAEDGWVLGIPDRGVAATLAETTKLRRDVLGLYLDDYARQWDAMIADISLKPFSSLSEATDELSLLSAPDSPLREILQSIDTQTQLSRTGAGDAAGAKAEATFAKVGKRAAGIGAFEAKGGMTFAESELASVLGESLGDAGGKPVDPATRVDEHFKWVHDFVAGKAGEPPPMEVAINKIQSMYQNFNQVASAANPGAILVQQAAGGGGGAGGGGSPAAQLAALSKDLPKPIAGMLQTVSDSGTKVASSGASASLSDAWRANVLPLCLQAFNRYPFVAGSSQDVPVDDFANLLGPGGLMDKFFNDNLQKLIDTSTTPWRWQSADHVSLGLSNDTLIEFQRAAAIRDAFYHGGAQSQVKFQLLLVSLDPALAKITLNIGGKSVTFDHGPPEPAGFVWPGQDGSTVVHITVTSTGSNGGETDTEEPGPWALLRLLDTARVIPSGQPDQFKLVFSYPAGSATFQLNASSVRNPFTMSALRNFRCPAKL
jgi:type VI secretion system protein ImpL